MPALYADKRDPLVGARPVSNARLAALHASGWATLCSTYKNLVKVVSTICKLKSDLWN